MLRTILRNDVVNVFVSAKVVRKNVSHHPCGARYGSRVRAERSEGEVPGIYYVSLVAVWQTGRVIVECTKEAVSKFDLTQPRSYNVVSLLLTARLGYLFTQTIVELGGIDELFDSHMHTIFPIVGVNGRHVDALIERIFAA